MFVCDITIIHAATPEKSTKIKKTVEFNWILFGPSEVTRLCKIKPHKAKYGAMHFIMRRKYFRIYIQYASRDVCRKDCIVMVWEGWDIAPVRTSLYDQACVKYFIVTHWMEKTIQKRLSCRMKIRFRSPSPTHAERGGQFAKYK